MRETEDAAVRRARFRRFRTQTEVNAEIARLIAIGDRHEANRDAAEFEGADYWRHHDDAMRFYERARLLMPRGS